MQRLTRLPHAELQIIISQMRRLSPACQQRILEGLPAWQHDILQAALKHRRHKELHPANFKPSTRIM